MSQAHFGELKEWSARKHSLLSAYLTGFVRILGGSKKSLVYYVDGFAGPGKYKDGSKGSPLLAAEYAQGLVGKHYGLHCINVEINRVYFQNLDSNTSQYHGVTTNLLGAFGDNVDLILQKINDYPAIFFLDPFGVKGIEAQYISKVLQRPHPTELLLRINPIDIQRLAGFLASQSVGASAKCQVLTDLYGFSDCSEWETVWQQEGSDGMISLYMERLGQRMLQARSKSYVCRYPIRAIDGELKYYLVFLTGHPKGAVLMNDTIYKQEETYERELAEYQSSRPQQLSMFDAVKPTEEQIAEAKVEAVSEDIWQSFQGRTADRLTIRASMLEKWFGRVKGAHFTRAFRKMRETGHIIEVCGNLSSDYTRITFSS